MIFHSIREYPIDLIPLDSYEYLHAHDIEIELYIYGGIEVTLKQGLASYHIFQNKISSSDVTGDIAIAMLYFLANTGFDLNEYVPNENVAKLISGQPDIAITELDRALIGFIYIWSLSYFSGPYTLDELKDKESLYSSICFLRNIQNYELKTHRTFDLSGRIDETLFVKALTDPTFSDTNSEMIILSESEVEDLNKALPYRERLIKAVLEDKKAETEFIRDEENECYFELFIELLNNRSSKEYRLLELINSEEEPLIKLRELELYLKETSSVDSTIPNSDISIITLYEKMRERASFASNYMHVESETGELVRLDNLFISSLRYPNSFNWLLIAYHAFLLKPSTTNIEFLSKALSRFIKNNLEQRYDEDSETYGTVEELLMSTSDTVFDFYDIYAEVIDSLRYDSIQSDETLSGSDFVADMMKQCNKRLRTMVKDFDEIFDNMDLSEQEFLMEKYMDFVESDWSEEEFIGMKNEISHGLSVQSTSETQLVYQEIANRIIASINAIYILVKTIDKLLSLNFFSGEVVNKLDKRREKLAGLEKYLVSRTYVAPNYTCFDKVDMEKYRLHRGIDATNIIRKNFELRQLALYDITKSNFQALHKEIANQDIESVLQIKEKFREEIRDYSDDETKQFVIELMEEESQYLSEVLISFISGNGDFNATKQALCNYIGDLSVLLPEGCLNALTTAEMLFSKYGNTKYASENFDYSGISALYYQAVENMYNELFWSKYSAYLNSLKQNGDWFAYLYKSNNLPANMLGYLPSGNPNHYLNKDKSRITNALTMGTFNFILYNITSRAKDTLPDFRAFFEKEFGYDNISRASVEYQTLQNRIDEFYSQMDSAVPKRNDASHGENAISFEKCCSDKMIVLSDLENVRKGSIGLIMQFLSLYRR